jgi:hypothetical protein
MEYITRTVKSDQGLSQEKALLTLQEHPSFVLGTRIASFSNQGGRWVAKLLEPKIAGENPFEDIDESPAELHEEKHESPNEEHEEHESPIGENEEHEDSEEKKIAELEKKIDLLLDALGISEKKEEPEVPTSPAADKPAAPAPNGPEGGPKGSNPLPPGSGAKLKPGEVPNKPGMTPVGAPAFASVKNAAASVANDSVAVNQGTPTSSGPSSASCPKCGAPNGKCGCNNPAANPVTSFTASRFDKDHELTIRQAKASIENELAKVGQDQNFRVARIKRDGDYIHALVTRNDS